MALLQNKVCYGCLCVCHAVRAFSANTQQQQRLLQGLSNPFLAARYHSLVIAKDSVPEVLEVTAWTEDGTVMAVQHKAYPQIQVYC